jgi:hypothetical protein
MNQKMKTKEEVDLQCLVSENYTAVLLVSADEKFNFHYLNKVWNTGYRGDTIALDSNNKVEEYFTGITSEFLPQLSQRPSFLVIMDLQTQKLDYCSLLNLHLTLSKEKKDWFKFMVCRDYHNCKDIKHALMHYDVLYFKSRDRIFSGNKMICNGSMSRKMLRENPVMKAIFSLIRFFSANLTKVHR